MKRNAFRTSMFAATAAAVALGGVAGTATAATTPVTQSSTSSTAYGYSAIVRHVSSATDGRGALVLVSAAGNSKTIGAVSDYASVFDISSSARTVITGFYEDTGKQLRLSIWDTETKKATYLRVAGGRDAKITADGIMVTRDGEPVQVYSRSGKLVRTLSGVADSAAVVSADGRSVVGNDPKTKSLRVVDVATGAVRATLIDGSKQVCQAAFAGSSKVTLDCLVGESTWNAYSSAYNGSGKQRVATHGGQARLVSSGAVYNTAFGDTSVVAVPAWVNASGVVKELKVNSAPNDAYAVSGAYGDTAYLVAGDLEYAPSGKLVRETLSTGQEVTLAGPGSKVGGLVSSAVTVDGN